MSRRLTLFRQTEGLGFVIFLPVYRTGRSLATVEERGRVSKASWPRPSGPTC